MKISLVFAALSLLTPAGCKLGPDFKPPKAPDVAGYTEAPLPAQTVSSPGRAGAAQAFERGRSIPAQWWRVFQSPSLDELMRRALANSPTLESARAVLRQARETRRAQSGTLFPQINANLSAEREKLSGSAIGQPGINIPEFNLYAATVSVSYALDIFGGARRQLEALESQVDYQRFQLEGAYLALTANIVVTAVQEAALRAQDAALREILASQQKQLAVLEAQWQLGGASGADVLAQRALAAQTRALLPPVEKQLAQTRHLLAVLCGDLPGEARLPRFDLEDLTLPRDLPVSLPSDLVRQRPDIMAAESLLHAASAQVGVATANLLPQVTLTGMFGTEATRPGKWFGPETTIWNFGAGLLQPVFRGGALTAQRRASIAAYDAAEAQYRETVLQAFRNVADALRALEVDARALQAQKDAETAARDSLDIAANQYAFGAVSYLALLNAERQFQQARINLAFAEAQRFSDTAALFQALGGGWWNDRDRAQTLGIGGAAN